MYDKQMIFPTFSDSSYWDEALIDKNNGFLRYLPKFK
jgi:hypothetical protein